MEFWLLAENRISRPEKLEMTTTKYTLPETKMNTACKDVLIFHFRRLW